METVLKLTNEQVVMIQQGLNALNQKGLSLVDSQNLIELSADISKAVEEQKKE